MPTKLTQEEFRSRAFKIHGNKFDYSETVVRGLSNSVHIICRTHGVFVSSPEKHLRFQCGGCRKCIDFKHKPSMTFIALIEKCKDIQGETYEYVSSSLVWDNGHQYLFLKCKEHGIFRREVVSHLLGSKCPLCAKKLMRPRIEQLVDLDDKVDILLKGR